MRRGMFVIPLVLATALLVLGAAQALEQSLATVAIGKPAISLLVQPGYGIPNAIGPLGRTARPDAFGPLPAASRAVAAPRVAAARPLASPAPGSTRVGTFDPSYTGGEEEEDRPSAPARTAAAPAAAISGTLIYWLYPRPQSRVIVGIDPKGQVQTVTVQGTALRGVTTTRGIGLGSPIDQIYRTYGYRSAAAAGATMRIDYPNEGVRFELRGLRVTEISIGKAPIAPARPVAAAPAAPAAPSLTPAASAAPGAPPSRPGARPGFDPWYTGGE